MKVFIKDYREITFDQLKAIMRDDIQYFPKVVKNVFCGNCSTTEIADYIIYLNKTGYVVLRGFCKKCGRPVARVIETDEDTRTAKRAKRIYKLTRKIKVVEEKIE
jgi:hypothetical protein